MFEYRSVLDRPMFDPFGWEDMFEGFDRLFRELNRESPVPQARGRDGVTEDDEKVTVTVDVPGLVDKDVRVEFADGHLSIAAERAVDVPQGYAPRRRERSAFRVSRSYALGDGFDPGKATAEIRDGALTVTVPKTPAAKKRTITVKAT